MSLSFSLPVRIYALTALLLVSGVSVLASEPVCQTASYHTAVAWHALPAEAAHEAAQQNKLLVVLHLSGNFAKTEFT